MLDVINDWVRQYGYVLVAVFLTVEAAGVPIPGESALVTAAAFAGRGTMHIVGVIIVASIGTIAGGHIGYWLGVRGGAKLVTTHGRWVGLSYDGPVVSGYAALARTQDEAKAVMQRLVDEAEAPA